MLYQSPYLLLRKLVYYPDHIIDTDMIFYSQYQYFDRIFYFTFSVFFQVNILKINI